MTPGVLSLIDLTFGLLAVGGAFLIGVQIGAQRHTCLPCTRRRVRPGKQRLTVLRGDVTHVRLIDPKRRATSPADAVHPRLFVLDEVI